MNKKLVGVAIIAVIVLLGVALFNTPKIKSVNGIIVENEVKELLIPKSFGAPIWAHSLPGVRTLILFEGGCVMINLGTDVRYIFVYDENS